MEGRLMLAEDLAQVAEKKRYLKRATWFKQRFGTKIVHEETGNLSKATSHPNSRMEISMNWHRLKWKVRGKCLWFRARVVAVFAVWETPPLTKKEEDYIDRNGW
jgi:hypothetical protein